MLQKQATEKLQNLTMENGKLQAFAFPGGYPIMYVTVDNGAICPACANGENGAECQNPEYQDDDSWILANWFIHYEGPAEWCEHCNAEIESAYGDPWAENEETTATA